MHHLYPAVIYGGSPENDVWNARFVAFGHILGIVEPGKVHHARAIGKVSHYARLAVSHVKRLETEYSAAYLDKRHVARQFVDGIDSTSVDMFVGVILQQVAKGIDAQFFAKHLFAVGSNPPPYTGYPVAVCRSSAERFGNSQVKGSGNLDIFSVALYHCDGMSIGLYHRRIVGKRLGERLAVGSLQ